MPKVQTTRVVPQSTAAYIFGFSQTLFSLETLLLRIRSGGKWYIAHRSREWCAKKEKEKKREKERKGNEKQNFLLVHACTCVLLQGREAGRLPGGVFQGTKARRRNKTKPCSPGRSRNLQGKAGSHHRGESSNGGRAADSSGGDAKNPSAQHLGETSRNGKGSMLHLGGSCWALLPAPKNNPVTVILNCCVLYFGWRVMREKRGGIVSISWGSGTNFGLHYLHYQNTWKRYYLQLDKMAKHARSDKAR